VFAGDRGQERQSFLETWEGGNLNRNQQQEREKKKNSRHIPGKQKKIEYTPSLTKVRRGSTGKEQPFSHHRRRHGGGSSGYGGEKGKEKRKIRKIEKGGGKNRHTPAESATMKRSFTLPAADTKRGGGAEEIT